MSRLPCLPLVSILLVFQGIALAQSLPDYEKPPLSYSATTPEDAFAELQARIRSGELAFLGHDKHAVGKLLAALGVPVESQILVFSKTSLQRGRIRPDRPRAIYFSDSIFVGWVPGGLVEIAAIDPRLGPIFYSFDLRHRQAGAPTSVREPDCLRCHGDAFVRDIPGLFSRSVFPSETGEPLLRFGSVLVDDQTPFEQRWGGWYVTGYHGAVPHRGNVVGSEAGEQLVFEPTLKRPDALTDFFETDDYLASTSDVVALLVFEHQTSTQNALTHAAYSCRRMLDYQQSLQAHFHEPVTSEPTYDSVKSVFESSAQAVVDRLLFFAEAPLPAGVVGMPEFREAFQKAAPRNAAGHSLKELSLRGQIFANRCSYLIYSDMFRMLPLPLKMRVLDRLRAALLSRDPNDRYSYLGSEEKQRIHDILIETHSDAAQRWKALARS